MKRTVLTCLMIIGISISLTSCYSYSHTVGRGPQKNEEIKGKNHYLFYGLKPLKLSNSQAMTDGCEDYELTVKHSIMDQILNGLSLGIYTPTTTVVRK